MAVPVRVWGWFVARPGRGPRWLLAAACALVVGMYWCNDDMGGDPHSPRGDGVYRPVLARGDGHMMYLMARSTALDLDWRFDNDLARFGDPWRQPVTRTGRKAIAHPIGPPLVWTPMIWLAEGGAVAANLVGADIELHGYTPWHQRFVFLSSALFACGAVLLGRRVAARAIGGAWSPSYAAVAVLLGTSLLYYATFMPSYAHAMSAFACAGFLAYWAHTLGRRDLRRWLALGALLGVATLIRVQELAMGCVVALEVALAIGQAVRAGRAVDALRWLGGGVLALSVTIVVFVPQLAEWHLVFGSVTELPQGAKYTRLEAPMIGELLFSSRNGWFSTTPIAYAAVIGLVLVPRRARLLGAGLLLAVVLQVYLNSTILDWWGSAGFGQRRMCDVTLPLVVGLAALIWRFNRLALRGRIPVVVRHAVLLVGFGAFVGANLARAIRLHGGKPAPADISPSCCGQFKGNGRVLAQWVYDRIGNPFQFPASALFALRHNVEWSRWDRAVGNYPLVPGLDTLLDQRLWDQRGAWRIGRPGFELYIVDGLGGSLTADRPYRWTIAPTATVLVPNLMPYGQRVTLWLAPGGARRAIVRWNGEVVAQPELDGWTAVTFDLPDIALHTNELAIEAEPGAFTAQGSFAAPAMPVGVAVGDLELAFLK